MYTDCRATSAMQCPQMERSAIAIESNADEGTAIDQGDCKRASK